MTNQIQLTVTYGDGHGIVTLDPEDGKPTTYHCTEAEALEIAEGMREEYYSNSPERKARFAEIRDWLDKPESERVQEITDQIISTVKGTANVLIGRDVHAS